MTGPFDERLVYCTNKHHWRTALAMVWPLAVFTNNGPEILGRDHATSNIIGWWGPSAYVQHWYRGAIIMPQEWTLGTDGKWFRTTWSTQDDHKKTVGGGST